MLTTGSITTETFSAALLGLEDLSLRITAAARVAGIATECIRTAKIAEYFNIMELYQ